MTLAQVAVSYPWVTGWNEQPAVLSGLPESLKCDQIRKQLAEHQLDFEVECVNQPGMVGFHVTRFSAGMSEQEAQQMAYQVITDYRSGPWEFTIDLGK